MWIKEHRQLYQGVSPERIWRKWIDIENWPSWHSDLEYCTLEGEFAVGNHFMLKPKGAPAVKITLTDIQWMKAFTDCTHFFGAKMWDTHTLEVTDNGILLTNKVVVTGPLKWLWIQLVAKNVAATAPDEMEALVNQLKREEP
ncbi:MAG: polyketide cyclase [Legionellales bacterium]|nr:polyketide cyclase [Legionellales bacterium]|tara:strand:- start:124 stop:549 length:426 start_codon:yes stop_codon:yes gene_type:complete